MSLDIQRDEREGIVILSLKGRIVAGEGAGRLREAAHEVAAAGGQRLILDLKQVDYIDSTGLGALVMCHTSMRKAGGVAKLLNLNKRTIELLVMTKLATVFEIFNDDQDAVNSFFPDREIKRFDILSFIQSQKD
ncbi:MAG: STAS domain-containing protein [Bryobacteraceae bacterium]